MRANPIIINLYDFTGINQVKSSFSFFRDDMCNGIRVTLEGGKELEVTATRKEIYDEMVKEVIKVDKEALRFYVLLGELQNISTVIPSSNLRSIFSDKELFISNPNVENAISFSALIIAFINVGFRFEILLLGDVIRTLLI